MVSFQKLNETIRNKILPSLFGNHVIEDEEDLPSLPVKKGGMSIMNPTYMTRPTFETSKQRSPILVSTIVNILPFNIDNFMQQMQKI